ncbi:hypothetical protein [Dyadobacter diqingensis]|uniref:hypothetical protein n=1 Tax=Dyadobacter diqingensis TaxID=2938121 RepID=UPI0020C18F34|nr:hypothetical protein [Dyadobacter diqingensis]
METLITIEQFNELSKANIILDGRKGGLIIGNSHKKGGIMMISASGLDFFCLVGEMEGFEFLLCHEATEKYLNEILEINSTMAAIRKKKVSLEKLWNTACKKNDGDLVVINAILDFEFPLTSKILFLKGKQFVVNKYSTLVHLKRLFEMNNEFL